MRTREVKKWDQPSDIPLRFMQPQHTRRVARLRKMREYYVEKAQLIDEPKLHASFTAYASAIEYALAIIGQYEHLSEIYHNEEITE